MLTKSRSEKRFLLRSVATHMDLRHRIVHKLDIAVIYDIYSTQHEALHCGGQIRGGCG